MRNQSATDSQQQTVTIGGLAPSVNLLYQLPCPAHMPHPRWRKHSRREGEKVGDLRRADELRLVCIEDVHRRAIIAPYDVLPVVHYFAGAKVEDNLTQRWRRLHSRPAVGGMKANVLRSVRCLPARTVPGTKEEATSPSSMDGVASWRDGNERR